MTDAKEAYKEWIFQGNCPCCFPDWEYSGVDASDVWGWADEFNAWGVYEEIFAREREDAE